MKVLILCCNGTELYELGAFTDVIGWTNSTLHKNIKSYICSNNKIIDCAFNKKIEADFLFDEINVNDFDALVIPGGFIGYGFFDDAFIKNSTDLINEFDKQGKIIVTTCVSSIIISKILDRNLTTYPYENERWINQLEKYNSNFINEKLVVDNNIISSQGPGTACLAALKLIELMFDNITKDKVKKYMQL